MASGAGLKAGVAEEARIRGFATPAFAGCALSMFERVYSMALYSAMLWCNRMANWRSAWTERSLLSSDFASRYILGKQDPETSRNWEMCAGKAAPGDPALRRGVCVVDP